MATYMGALAMLSTAIPFAILSNRKPQVPRLLLEV